MADTVFIHSIIASFFFRHQNYQSFNSHNPFYRLINYTFFFAHGHETFFVQIVRLYFFLFSDCMEPSRGLSSSLRTSSYTNPHTILDKLVYCLFLRFCFPPSVVLISERTFAAGLRTDFSNSLPSLLNGGEIGIWPKQFEIFCPSLSHWRYEVYFDKRKQKSSKS